MRRFLVGGLAGLAGLALAIGIAGAETSLDPDSLDFGEQVIGTESAPLTATLTVSCDQPEPELNANSADFTIQGTTTEPTCTTDSFSPDIGTSGPFSQTNDCPPTLTGTEATGPEYCTIEVTFQPDTVGPHTGELFTGKGGPSIPLSGVGIAPPPPRPPVVVAAAAAPQPTCAGQPVTIVGTGGTTNGTPGRDVILGTDVRDVINAGAGNDLVCAKAGNDKVKGQQGDDDLNGGPNKDKLFGGPDDDILRGGLGKDTLIGGPGKNVFNPSPNVGPIQDSCIDGSGKPVPC